MSPRLISLALLILTLLGWPLHAQVVVEKKEVLSSAPPSKAAWPANDPLPVGARLRLGSGGAFLAEYQGTAALSPDGKYLAIANMSQAVILHELATGKELARMTGPNNGGAAQFVGFAPDGKSLGFGGFGGFTVAEVPSGKVRQNFRINGAFHANRGHVVSFSADGRLVTMGNEVAGAPQQQPVVWEVPTGKMFGPYTLGQNNGYWTALAPDGKMLATWNRNYQRNFNPNQQPVEPQTLIQLWDVATAKEVRAIKAEPNLHVNAALFAPDGKTLVASTGQANFHLFDLATGKELRRFAGRRGQTSVLRFSPDGKLLVAGGHDGNLQAWDLTDGRRLELAPGPRAHLLSVAFPAEGRLLALGVLGQSLAWWDAISGKAGFLPYGHHLPVTALMYAADGKTLTSASNDGQLYSWDTSSGKIADQFSLSDDDFQQLGRGVSRYTALALSADGRFVAGSNQMTGGSIRLWNLRTRQVLCDFDAERNGNPVGLAFAPDGNRLAAGALQGVQLWDTTRGQMQVRLTFPPKQNQFNNGQGTHAAVAPGGALVAVPISWFENMGGQLSQVSVLDAATGKERYSLPGPQNAGMPVVAFAPDGKHLAMASPGTGVVLVKAASGKEWLRLHRPGDQSYMQKSALAFAPDGRTLAVATDGQQVFDATGRMMRFGSPTIEVWEIASGRLRQSFHGHRSSVSCLAFAPDGRTLASGSSDTTVVLWNTLGPPAPAAALTAKELEVAWGELQAQDAAAALRTMGRLLASPAQTVALLKEKLQPAPDGSAERAKVPELVTGLDSENFTRREEAFRTLVRMGAAAEPALRKAHTANASLEVRRRLEELLGRLERGQPSQQEIQLLRAMEVLERIGGGEAQALLEVLAHGDETALITQEAQKVLSRMQRQTG
jgi:WD40 repeat protein